MEAQEERQRSRLSWRPARLGLQSSHSRYAGAYTCIPPPHPHQSHTIISAAYACGATAFKRWGGQECTHLQLPPLQMPRSRQSACDPQVSWPGNPAALLHSSDTSGQSTVLRYFSSAWNPRVLGRTMVFSDGQGTSCTPVCMLQVQCEWYMPQIRLHARCQGLWYHLSM